MSMLEVNIMQSKTDRKICGTCEYWSGNREPIFDKKGIPKINIIDANALCCKTNCRFTDQIRKNNLNCKMYSKWTELL